LNPPPKPSKAGLVGVPAPVDEGNLKAGKGIVPQIFTTKGLIPSTAKGEDVELKVTKVEPLKWNPQGGDLITITGSGFPTSVAPATSLVSVVFDGSDSPCLVQSSKYSSITCLTTDEQDLSETTGVTVKVGTEEANLKIEKLTFNEVVSITKIEPISVSPILK